MLSTDGSSCINVVGLIVACSMFLMAQVVLLLVWGCVWQRRRRNKLDECNTPSIDILYSSSIALSPMFPDTHMVGMEIRVKVSDYVQDRIKALRAQHPGQYRNVACIRTNAMKHLPNFFRKGQLTKMFFLFPDPHFKKQKHKWRIISRQLLAEYAYVLRVQGLLYTITDVKELHDWMVSHLAEHPLFERVPEEDLKTDVVVEKLYESTEEGKKVTRNSGEKFLAVFRRIEDPYVESSGQESIEMKDGSE
ncbi:hypothetical protein HPB52_014961 [Rhipicephalus sanguineus]|uniref:tRNA (guanine-N(7)-)-methyltransferase n=1 Tax=Rhipicephalus sanguineus TaxID=34632 RepID=A0A9D4PEF2_RHISA|nr:hypothetical protein HPB52_014961 [Rhipicephalus sanguineus]